MANILPVTPVCHGLLIQVSGKDASTRRAQALARRVVARNLRGTWRVAPLGRRSAFFEVTPRRRRTIPLASAWNLVHRLKADRDVRAAEPALMLPGLEPHVARTRAQLTSREQSRAKSVRQDAHRPGTEDPEWSIRSSRIDRAWALRPSRGKRFGEGVIVGHPDTGYTLHPEIWNNPGGVQRIRSHAGYDFVDDKPFPVDPLVKPHPSHGTKTASIIMSDAGTAGSGTTWVSGAAPLAQLIPYRVIKSVIVIDFTNVAKAILRAVDSGCHVISMSLGGPIHSHALEDAVRVAIERDVIVLAAAGNVWPWVVYPAKLERVIAVAASNRDDAPWKSSASGETVDVTAPGESVWRAETRKAAVPFTQGRGSGTSFAVATAAGITALWLAFHGRDRLIQRYGPGRLVSIYKETLMTRGVRRPTGWNTGKYGTGIIDAARLLQAPLPATPPAEGMGPLAAKRSRARRTRGRVLADLGDFLPARSPARVRAALSSALRVPDADLDLLLAEMGDELTFHVATDTALREALQGGSRVPAKAAPGRMRRAVPIRHASPALKKRLNR